jgi:hypothetical protein
VLLLLLLHAVSHTHTHTHTTSPPPFTHHHHHHYHHHHHPYIYIIIIINHQKSVKNKHIHKISSSVPRAVQGLTRIFSYAQVRSDKSYTIQKFKKEHDIFDMIEINSECGKKKMKWKGSLEVLNKCTISKL